MSSANPLSAAPRTPFQQNWDRFRKNKAALASLVLLALFTWVGALGYLLTPDKTTNANAITPEAALLSPGSKLTLLRVYSAPPRNVNFIELMIRGDDNAVRFYPITEYAVTDTGVTVQRLMGAGIPTKAFSYSFASIGATGKDLNEIKRNHIVERKFLLGTDNLGRDIFSRLLLGLRVSLSVGFVAVIISLLVGITLGSIAGYFGGRIDDVVQWIINVIWAIPTILLVFAITVLLGKGFWQIFLAVGLTMWVGAARIVRGQVLGVKQLEYVEAANALGFGTARIVVRHILPNILGPIMVVAAANFATAILLEAGLSFLGIGVQPPTPSWGAMIKDNYGYIVSDMPYMALVPGAAIMILVLLLNMIGNGIRDALDVKTNRA
ncbi:MAG TPA: ABC transporter permease [Chitinophagales bacterium]|nr:ABC transporter permease [Chitinophagales bacterium]